MLLILCSLGSIFKDTNILTGSPKPLGDTNVTLLGTTPTDTEKGPENEQDGAKQGVTYISCV